MVHVRVRVRAHAHTLWICAHIHVCAFWVCTYGDQRTISNVILQRCPPWFLRQSLSLGPGANQFRDPGLFINFMDPFAFVSPAQGDYRSYCYHYYYYYYYYLSAGSQTQVLVFEWQELFEMLTVFLRCV